MAKRIDSDILEVLSRMKCEGDMLVEFHEKLDRKDYERLNKVIMALGGKWSRSRRGHVFAGENAAELVADAVATGVYVDQRKAFQQFFTPPELARQLVKTAGVKSGMRCLEPSAGEGAIASAMVDAGGLVECVEIDPKLVAKLHKQERYEAVQEADFLHVMFAEMFDRVVMNPPFTKSQDIAHVQHAWRFVRPGGRLVSIMASGVTFREDTKARAFREFAEQHGTIELNDEGAFRESGTMVSTVTVVVDKPD